MTNPIKSQIAANRERFEAKLKSSEQPFTFDNKWGDVDFDRIRDFITTSQISLLQTAIAGVEGMKVEVEEPGYEPPTDPMIAADQAFNHALSKVVDLLKGGITD